MLAEYRVLSFHEEDDVGNESDNDCEPERVVERKIELIYHDHLVIPGFCFIDERNLYVRQGNPVWVFRSVDIGSYLNLVRTEREYCLTVSPRQGECYRETDEHHHVLAPGLVLPHHLVIGRTEFSLHETRQLHHLPRVIVDVDDLKEHDKRGDQVLEERLEEFGQIPCRPGEGTPGVTCHEETNGGVLTEHVDVLESIVGPAKVRHAKFFQKVTVKSN